MPKERSHILEKALLRVPFEGWTDSMLAKAAQDAGHAKEIARMTFPEGGRGCLLFFIEEADRKMMEALQTMPLAEMKMRERIAAIVMKRLEQNLPYREGVRRGQALLLLPQNVWAGLKALYGTVDAMWHAAGDHSTDFNFYTKRLMLAGIYTSTLQIWLDDDSARLQTTHAFLQRRIADVMRIEKLKANVRNVASRCKKLVSVVPSPRRML